MLEEQSRDPEVRRRNEDPYGINPGECRSGPDGPDSFRITWDADFGQWTGPFIMASVDTRVVRRSNALLANAERGSSGPRVSSGITLMTSPGSSVVRWVSPSVKPAMST